MQVRKVKIRAPQGLHLREAAKVVNFSKRCKSRISLCRGCKFAEGCSILSILALGAAKDDELAVIAEGPDEREVIKDIGQVFDCGAGI